MTTIYVELATNTIFIISILYLTLSLSNVKWRDIRKTNLLFIPLYALLLLIVVLHSSSISYTLISILFSIILAKIYTKQNFGFVVMTHIISYSILGILQIIFILCLPVSTKSINSPTIQIIGQLCLLILCVILYHFFPLHSLIQSDHIITKVTRRTLTFIYLLIIIASIYSKYNTQDILLNLPLTFLFILCLLYCLYQNFQQHKNYIQLQTNLDDYKKYKPIFEELVEHVRTRQHEFDNQLMAIRSLPIAHKDYASLSYALTNTCADITESLQNSSLLKLNLKVLSAFLFSKVQQANKKNIHIGILIKNSYLQTIVPEHELLEIIGILLDNAVEAVDSGDSITLILDSSNNKINITTLNKGQQINSELRHLFFQKNYSTKNPTFSKQQRGIGLHRLKQIIDNYGGQIFLDNEIVDNDTLICFQIIV